jgi:hypothetical protein
MFEKKKRDNREKRCQRIGYSIRKFVCSLLTASTEKVSLSLSSSFLMWNHHRTRRKEDYKHTHTQREREKGERERKTKAAKRCFCSSVKIRQKPPQMMFDFAEVRKVRVKKTNREI